MNRDHQLSEHCWCGPTLVPVKRDDGSMGWNYAHHEPDQTLEQEAERAARIAEAIDEQRQDTA